MFDNRCMYYLTIVVVMLFSVSFIKLNKFWELDVRYGEVESEVWGRLFLKASDS